jgi:hypothetical protein
MSGNVLAVDIGATKIEEVGVVSPTRTLVERNPPPHRPRWTRTTSSRRWLG